MVQLRVRPLAGLLVALSLAGGAWLVSPGAAAVAKKPEDSGMLNWKKVRAGTTRTIFSTKQFRVLGMCQDNGGGDFTARAFLETRQDHATYSGSGVDLDFNRADAPVQFNVFHEATGTAPGFEALDASQEIYAEAANGVVFIARIATGVHVFGADCTFSGLFLTNKTQTPPLDRRALAVGTSATLFENADFKLVGDCIDNGGGEYIAHASLFTKQDDAMYNTTFPGPPTTNWDVADGPVQVGVDADSTTPQFIGIDIYDETTAVAANGHLLIARVAEGVHRGADCTFSGLVTDSRRDTTRSMVFISRGTSTVLWDDNHFRVVGTCIDNGGGDIKAQTYLETNDPGSMYFVSDSGFPVFGFGPASPPVPFDHYGASGTTPRFAGYDYYDEVYAVSGTGRALIARPVTAVHVLGNDCGFALSAQD